MDFDKLAVSRQSVRNYDKTKEVAFEDVKKCLETAMISPSACNSQPWHFTIVKGEKSAEVAKLTQSMGMNKFTSDVSTFVVISEGAYNKTALVGSKVKDQDYRSVDIGIATAHLCLQATDLGISTCILGWFDEKKLQALLGIKSRIRLVIAMGYASEDDKLRNKVRKDFEDVVSEA